jgi:outer membrane murein-binding lipoprotein Lpp
MTIYKAQWATDGDNLRLSMPLSKIDQERRIVSGFATLDNIDKQADIVTTEASIKAFSKFRGNIREMHQPTAVGKMVNFKEDKYFDSETKKFYSGVFVSAYVSKGAQDTWEKVLDGTLSGFSIGGRMNKWDDAYDSKMDAQVRIIKDYDLVELSLEDNPANEFANIVSIEKVDGVDTVKGDITEISVENVFWDDESGIATISENESENSPVTGKPMQNIGFVEKNDSEKTEMIKFLVDSAKGIDLSKMIKEASPMNETTEDVAKSDDVVEEAQVAPEADATEDAVEKSYSEDKTMEEKSKTEKSGHPMDEEEEEDMDKAMDEEDTKKSEDMDEDDAAKDEVSKSDEVIVESVSEIKNTLTSAFSDLALTIKALHEQVNALSKSVEAVSGEVNSVKSEVQSAKSDFNEFGKRVDAVEADTAFRKSGDLGEIVQEQSENRVEKSLWGGRFLKTADLFS